MLPFILHPFNKTHLEHRSCTRHRFSQWTNTGGQGEILIHLCETDFLVRWLDTAYNPDETIIHETVNCLIITISASKRISRCYESLSRGSGLACESGKISSRKEYLNWVAPIGPAQKSTALHSKGAHIAHFRVRSGCPEPWKPCPKDLKPGSMACVDLFPGSVIPRGTMDKSLQASGVARRGSLQSGSVHEIWCATLGCSQVLSWWEKGWRMGKEGRRGFAH